MREKRHIPARFSLSSKPWYGTGFISLKSLYRRVGCLQEPPPDTTILLMQQNVLPEIPVITDNQLDDPKVKIVYPGV